MTTQDEITRAADRLTDAFGAAADVMTVADSRVPDAAADVIAYGDGPARIRGPRTGHPWRWLLPLTAAASVAVIALATVLIGHATWNTAAGGPSTQVLSGVGRVQLVNVPAPDPAVLDSPGYLAARSRVVKILGTAPECGRGIEGSGFVYAPEHVITNAHVVAGDTRQTVTTAPGVVYRAQVVFYDPRIDIAVLYVPGLNLAPLRFSTLANPGDDAVVAGYPEDHPFTAAAARIGQVFRAESQDIYGSGQVDRQVYQIRGDIEPGNSGGPLLSPGGTVDGVVIAAAGGEPDTGFALTASQVRADATAGAQATVPVPTQGCTSG